MIRFYLGCHQPSDAKFFEYCCINISRLINRKYSRNFSPNRWILDAGIFCKRPSLSQYIWAAKRWSNCGILEAVVTPDFLCHPLNCLTDNVIKQYQSLTINNYDILKFNMRERIYVMPVLQGASIFDYINHLKQYDNRINLNSWVGVGSLRCRLRSEVFQILNAIKTKRPDLKLHGFGCGLKLLKYPEIRHLLSSADSSAWSKTAYKYNCNSNSPDEAYKYLKKLAHFDSQPHQVPLLLNY